MILKSFNVEKNQSNIKNFKSILIYGENGGLRDNIKELIKKGSKEGEYINFFQDEIIKNKNLLKDEVINGSLFNVEKIIFIHDANDKIYDHLQEILINIKGRDKIIILSNLLDKKSKLRNLFEKDDRLAIVPCYQDDQRALSNYIRQELKEFSGLSSEIINLIINNSDENRRIVDNEIIKIKTLFIDKKIDFEKLRKLMNIKTNSGFEKLRDASLLGDINFVNKSLSTISIIREDIYFYLNQLTQRINKLLEIHRINKEYKNSDLAVENITPKIFWKDKPMFKNQIKKLNENDLNSILQEIGNAEILMKKETKIRNDIIIKNLIVNISLRARSIS